MYTPVNPRFYYIKVGFKGVKNIGMFRWWKKLFLERKVSNGLHDLEKYADWINCNQSKQKNPHSRAVSARFLILKIHFLSQSVFLGTKLRTGTIPSHSICPKFPERESRANSFRTRHLIRRYTVCHSANNFRHTHKHIVDCTTLILGEL